MISFILRVVLCALLPVFAYAQTQTTVNGIPVPFPQSIGGTGVTNSYDLAAKVGTVQNVVSSGTVTASATTVNWTPSPCGDGTINLPASPVDNEPHTIINAGLCPSNSLTVAGNGHNIGLASSIVSTTAGALDLRYSSAYGAWQVGGVAGVVAAPGFTPLNAANNLSDIVNVATARANLGLGTIATQSAAFVAITGGTIALDSGIVGNGTAFAVGNPTGGGYQPSASIPVEAIISAAGAKNGFIGQVTNTVPYASNPFLAVGTTGYGKVPSGVASVVFGLFGLAEINNSFGQAVGGEVTARNFSGGAANTGVPPPFASPSSTLIADGFHITCGIEVGTSDCSTGLFISNEAAGTDVTKASFANGLIVNGYRAFGIYVEPGYTTGTQTSIEADNNGNGVNLVLKTTGTMTDANAVLTVNKADGTLEAAVYQNGDIHGNTITGTGFVAGADQFSGVFGPVAMLVATASGSLNNAVFQLNNNAGSALSTLPVALTGACKVTSTTFSNDCFGLYGLAEARWTGTGGVAVGGEVTARNFTSNNPDTNLPPSEGFGTSTSVINGWQVTCGAGGGETHDCSIGAYIANETGSISDPVFNTAEYISLYRQYGLFIDAPASGNQTGLVVKGNGNGVIASIQSTAAGSPSDTGLEIAASGTPVAAWRTNGEIDLTQSQSTVGATGAASALPANPLGYFKFQANGTEVVVPYYNH